MHLYTINGNIYITTIYTNEWFSGIQASWHSRIHHNLMWLVTSYIANHLVLKLGELGQYHDCRWSGGRFKNAYELLNLRALRISMLYKSHIFQCMGKIFCVEFQRVPLKFHTKYLTHTLKDKSLWNIEILRALRVKSSYKFLKRPPGLLRHLNIGIHGVDNTVQTGLCILIGR